MRLEGVTLSAATAALTVDSVGLGWGLGGARDVRAHVRHVSLRGVRIERGPLVVEWPAAELDILSWRRGAGEEHVRVRQPAGGELDVRWRVARDGGARPRSS